MPPPRETRRLGGLAVLAAVLLVCAGLALRWPMPILAIIFVALSAVSFAIWFYGTPRTRKRV